MTMYPKEQVDSLVDKLVATYGDGGIWPSARQWRALLENDKDERIVVLHFFKFKDKAVYPDDPDCDISGFEAATDRYGEDAIIPKEAGQKLTHYGTSPIVVMGPEEVWDCICVMEYPNRHSFVSLFLDPGYIKGIHHRNAGAERHRTVIATLEPLPPLD